MESVTKDLIHSNDDYFEPPQKDFFALRRLFGYFAIRARDMVRYCSPWMVWSLSGTLCLMMISSCASFVDALLSLFGTLSLPLISSCAPFVDGLLFSAAIIKHHDTWLTSRLQRHLFLSPPRVTMILRDLCYQYDVDRSAWSQESCLDTAERKRNIIIAEWRLLHHQSYSRAGRKWLGFTCFIIFIS